MSEAVNCWDRLMWAIRFRDVGSDFLIGEAWDRRYPPSTAIPSRALVFRTRKAAQAWCRAAMSEWAKGDHILRRWKVSPVRVRETIRPDTGQRRGAG